MPANCANTTNLETMSFDPNAAAALLWQHWQAGTALAALPERLRPNTRAEGHAIQALLPRAADRAVLGWKIAATSAGGQAHIGVSGPLAGRILAGELQFSGPTLAGEWQLAPGDDADLPTIALHGNRMGVAEPEFAFRMGADLPPRSRPYSVQEVLAAVATLHPAFEAPNSRFADFAHAGEAQLQADNACSGRFVIGAPAPVNWRALDLRQLQVQGRVIDATGVRLDRSGDGSAVLGDPRIALAWLSNELSGLGLTLRAGDVVSTGTCMVPLPVKPGDKVEADFGVMGRLSARFVD